MTPSKQKDFDPIMFIDVAKDISGFNGREEVCRTIINRCYYAAFGHIKPAFGHIENNLSVHSKLISVLKRTPNYEIIGSKLEALFNQRKEADYCYYHHQSKDTCYFTIESTKALIKEFDELQNQEKPY